MRRHHSRVRRIKHIDERFRPPWIFLLDILKGASLSSTTLEGNFEWEGYWLEFRIRPDKSDVPALMRVAGLRGSWVEGWKGINACYE
ncbi:hypothetical protein RclHR1_27570001 [Rhizophagus clarus]|uniref:Uncharacterized protein n=1 Tax=Rhizophagus clarus TaxID=94130 RepID=A0A2Z6RWY4_9GLOM|nr:hypothetical protein RclHR1_27570001 [Rhizophagus clarus]